MQTPNTITENTVNFMYGNSYKMNPLQTMQMVCTSMICGESQYYRPKKNMQRNFISYFLFHPFYKMQANATFSSDIYFYFMQIIDDALDYDFKGCLDFICKLRNEHFMRLNSHLLITRAIHHPKRVSFNMTHPTLFCNAIESACNIPTDWTTQYKLLQESGKPIPTIWKKTIAKELEKMTRYHGSKYIHGSKTQGKTGSRFANLVDLVRITHPKPTPVLNELIENGKISVEDNENTWEKLRSSGYSWVKINDLLKLPHMALLRNLRNIVREYCTLESSDAISRIRELVQQLIAGVKSGKQFPFRYYTAYKRFTSENTVMSRTYRRRSRNAFIADIAGKPLYFILSDIILTGLNDCLLESLDTIPSLPGRVDCLTDNSGSARGAFTSEYGSVGIYEISNLSAILTAFRSTKGGSVWIFGDTLQEYVVSKERSILEQLKEVNAIGHNIGGSTETGVWLFWEKVIKESLSLDHVFIYSDMQAGLGQLYTNSAYIDIDTMKLLGGVVNESDAIYQTAHINVLSLVNRYRRDVNPKMNLFSVQVAGYDNSIMPDILYRGALLSGWTGKEAKLASEMSQLWDIIEAGNN